MNVQIEARSKALAEGHGRAPRPARSRGAWAGWRCQRWVAASLRQKPTWPRGLTNRTGRNAASSGGVSGDGSLMEPGNVGDVGAGCYATSVKLRFRSRGGSRPGPAWRTAFLVPPSLSLFNVPVTRPRLFKLSFALLIGAAAVAACSIDNADMGVGPCGSINCDRPPLGVPVPTEVPASSAGAPDASAPLTLVKGACGVGSCLPDDAQACSDYVPPGGSVADAGADAGLDAGVSAEPGSDAGADGGVGAPSVDGSFERPRPGASSRGFACQLSLSEGNRVERSCGASGLQAIDDACTSSLDCEPGLGCVGMVRSGRCLPYCCEANDATCQDGSYCVERPLRNEVLGESDGPLVPVCDRADNCSLSELPGCEGAHCVCRGETVCMAVRDDGTTACVLPGPGRAGEDCPCQFGYHCSQSRAKGMCVPTCELAKGNVSCGAGVCQATPVLPTGWGICVGATAEDMAVP